LYYKSYSANDGAYKSRDVDT